MVRGALAAAHVCETFAPRVDVPLWTCASERKFAVNHWPAISAQLRTAQRVLSERQAKRVLTVGGDCSVDVAVINYLNRTYPNLNVIWIDAHLDANTPETSPSGNFHGMPVAVLLGQGPSALANELDAPLCASRFRYVGAHIGDAGDWHFRRQHGLKNLGQDPLSHGPLHIHFDLDVLHPSDFPYVAYPEGDVSLADALSLLRSLASSRDVVGLTITEFAPPDETAAAAGSTTIRQICNAVAGV